MVSKIIRYTVNEPFYVGDGWKRCLDREIKIMQYAKADGYRVSVAHFPVGAIQPNWIADGIFDDFLRALDGCGEYCWLGVHEYTSAVLSFGIGLWPMDCLLEPACVEPENWPTIEDVPLAYTNAAFSAQGFVDEIRTDIPFGDAAREYYYGLLYRDEMTAQGALGTNLPTYWHIRRADWFLLRADTIGVARPRILITEGSHDHLNDIDAVLNPLEAQYGLVEHMYDLRGIPTYCKLWAFYWPDWSCAEAAFYQYEHLNEVLYWSEEYEAVFIFTCSSHPMWRAFDVCHNEVGRNLQEMFIDYSRRIRVSS